MIKKRTFLQSIFLFICALCYSLNTYAQSIVVKGKVTSSDNEPLIGVSIMDKVSKSGTVTDLDGNYSLKISPNSTLDFSYVGYKSVQVKVAGKKIINVTLKDNSELMDEVVVIGYGTQRKIELTGAVASVKSEDISRIGGSNFSDALQGQLAGVNVQASSGAPGASANIQIRGIGSLSSGSLGPLYVVDGIPYDGDPNLSPSEIESIEVLKDAASASIYGTRASNGVILVTTKKGVAGKLKISLDGYYGVQKITSGIKLMNTSDYLLINQLSTELNGAPGETAYNPLDQMPDGLYYDTDWLKELTNDYAPIQNYSLSISGGQKELTHNLILNYFSQDGVMVKSDYQKFSVRSNTNFKRNKFSAMASIGLNYSTSNDTPYGLHDSAIKASPMSKPRSMDKDIDVSDDYDSQNVSKFTLLLKQINKTVSDGYNMNLSLNYELLPGLVATINSGGSMSHGYKKYFVPKYQVFSSNGVLQSGGNDIASLQETFTKGTKLSGEFTLKYEKKFNGGHKLNLLAGFSSEKSTWDTRIIKKQGFLSNEINTPDAGTGGDNVSGTNSANTLVGILGRAMYNYQDKYLLSVSARRDGSSRFGVEKWATFPAASIGWNLSEESFYKKTSLKKVMNDFKLRASIGTAGNQGIPNYSYETSIYTNTDYVLGNGEQGNIMYGAIQRGYANPTVKWETSLSRNIGIDMAFLKSALTVNLDYYYVNKENMLLPVSLPASSGVPTDDWQFKDVKLNVGDMYNKGFEAAVSYKGNIKDFTYRVTGTFSKNVNKVTKTYIPTNYISGGQPTIGRNTENTTYVRQGYPAGSFFLIPNKGTIKTEEELAEYKKIVGSAKLGDLWIEDTNNDGKINDNDRVYCGSGTPDWEAGLNINAGYKNFDFNMQLYGTYGNKVYNGSKLYAYICGRHKDLIYCWSPWNPNSNVPSIRKELEHNNIRSINNYYLEDGSYLRIKNVQVGYTLSKQILRNLGLTNLRLYVSAENPITFTKYTGYDPEIGGDGIFTKGVDRGSYPVASQYRFGVQIGF